MDFRDDETGQHTRRVGTMASPGSYTVTLSVNGRTFTRSVTVLEDVWMNQ